MEILSPAIKLVKVIAARVGGHKVAISLIAAFISSI
jgi:hypothetical protein